MEIFPFFRDRHEAGKVLAEYVAKSLHDPNALVLALPRGGVPVGFEVARALPAALDVFLVRKLGVPGYEELAIGAIASGGVRVLNQNLIEMLQLSQGLIDSIAEREQRELERREQAYREGRPAVDVQDRTVILVDDGLATGASMLAAARAVRPRRPKRVIVAVPVASRAACDEFRNEVHEVICAATPEPFTSVGQWYQDFSQTTDEEVRSLLARAAQERVSMGEYNARDSR